MTPSVAPPDPAPGRRGPAAASADPEPAATVAFQEQLPRRRRRLGLGLVALGVLALAAQSWTEWLLPYDLAALDAARRLATWPTLGAATLIWSWALVCCAALGVLARQRPWPWPLALAAGLLLGSAHAAAGGAAAALAVLLLVGVASLGWQAGREGGLALLLGTALSVAIWDAAQSAYPSLWMVAGVLAAMFGWIDYQHIRGSDRRLYGALAEREALIGRLDQRTAELTSLQRARTQMLAGISHDLRQPLQAVRLFAEALQARADGSDPRPSRELLRQQMRAADDAVAMLDQFSEISAIEQGALQSQPEWLDVRELLDDVADSLRNTQPDSRLRLRVHGRHHGVFMDRSQLSRIVQNLAGNAVRYSLGLRPGQAARVLLAVRPSTAADGLGLNLEVLDNGRGIPSDQLQAVFEPYVQLPQADAGASRAGRGLGLAIVRGLVAQLGLTMAPVCSIRGRGTRFRVRIPATHCRPLPAPAPIPVTTPEGTPDSVAQPRVPTADERLDGWLLALLDDETAPRAALRAALESVGATVIDAATPQDLHERLDAQARFPDALVLDLDLGPGQVDGLAVLYECRETWELTVPAVVVTGRIAVLGTVPLPRACSLLGKPVALASLVAALRRQAERARAPPRGSTVSPR